MKAREVAGFPSYSKFLEYISSITHDQAKECFELLKHPKEIRNNELKIETSMTNRCVKKGINSVRNLPVTIRERDMNEKNKNINSSIKNITQILTSLNDKTKSIANLLENDCTSISVKGTHCLYLKRIDNSAISGKLIADELKESLQSIQKLKNNLADITADRIRQKENKMYVDKGTRKKEILKCKIKERV